MAQGRQAVDAIPATPPVYGLLVAADLAEPTLDGRPARWQQGIEWAPELMGGGASGAVACEGNTTTLEVDDPDVIQTADPFNVYASDQCSTFGFEARDYEGRARRQLLATQSFSIAREFQLGEIRNSAGLGNVCLVDAENIGPAPASVTNAIAELEAAIGDTLKGRRAMIHVGPQAFAGMKAAHLIEMQGQKWVTAQGTIVAADAGYTTESDGKLYAYATNLVKVALSDVAIIPGSFADALARAQMTNRSVNTITLYSERLALVWFDGTKTGVPGEDEADAVIKVQLSIDPYVVSS